MPKRQRRWIVLGLAVAALLAVPAILWVSLTLEPEFYRAQAALPRAARASEAKQFVARSLRLRNDIVNEPRWEAAFTDQQVNSWLAEDLVTHFADQIPDGVHEPRVAFETDRVSLGFELDQGPIRSVVWVVARVRVPEANVLALTLEKIRAGVVPIPADRLLDRITEQGRRRGLDIRWERDGDLPMALIRYTPDPNRRDVVVEAVQVLNGQIRLAGRSSRARGKVALPTLPTRRVLQMTFPRRKYQRTRDVSDRSRHNSANPLS